MFINNCYSWSSFRSGGGICLTGSGSGWRRCKMLEGRAKYKFVLGFKEHKSGGAEKSENMFLLEEWWLSTALGPGVKGQASVEVESPAFFCSRKSHYLLEITLLSSKTNSTCNGFRTKTFCRNLQRDAALVLLLEPRGSVILSSYFRGDTDHVSTRVALIGFQFAVVALGEGNIFHEKLLRASKKNKMYFLPDVS